MSKSGIIIGNRREIASSNNDSNRVILRGAMRYLQTIECIIIVPSNERFCDVAKRRDACEL